MLERLQRVKWKTFVSGTALALGLSAVTGAVLTRGLNDRNPQVSKGAPWGEVPWPFPADLWSSGKAFRCNPADCGGNVTLYLRAKIGLCNRATGVADDEELERLGDIELLGGHQISDGPGRPITVGWMKGRSRSYRFIGAKTSKSALMIAFNDRYDAVVGTAVTDIDDPIRIEQAVIDFLNGDTVLKWAQVNLGL